MLQKPPLMLMFSTKRLLLQCIKIFNNNDNDINDNLYKELT